MFQFNTTPKVVNGPDALSQLPTICAELGFKKPLIISDPGLEDAGLLEQLEHILNDARQKFATYTEVEADPSDKIVLKAADFAAAHGVDSVIGFGGGSSLDTAKLVALLTNSDESLDDIYGVDNVSGQRLPLIQIPTTSGTGSEVTPVAIVTTDDGKAGVVSSRLLPDLALLDATLTLGLPPSITAMTGIDAMVHAIEAYTSAIKKNTYSDMFATQALRLMGDNIIEAFENGSNLDARQAMLTGACMAGQAFANAPVGAIHALAYPLGTNYHLPHGLTNSLVMPAVMRFNAPSAANEYAELAPIVFKHIDFTGSNSEKSEQLISQIEQLISRLELPTRLSELGVKEQELPRLAHEALLQQRLLVNNPKVVNEDDALALYRSIF